MRLFTGISLPPEVRAPLLTVTDQLRPLAKLAWTSEDKLHITTKFIGEWPESRLEELKQVLVAVEASGPVEVHIRRLGWMPNPRHPLTLCAGVEASEGLTGLARETEGVLEQIGILREQRVYRPHVTLGRVRRTGRDDIAALQRAVEAAGIEIAPFRAGNFHLYLSENGTYTKISTYAL